MQKKIKRLIDIILSLVGLIVLSPLFLLTIILVYTNLGSPVFFRQERVGKNCKHFKIIKFRSMLDKINKDNMLVEEKDRLTTFGKILRSTSIDELPQLVNVLKGDMSIVGPRPLLIEYKPLYSKEQSRRHNMKPGITGLAQVKGRNSLLWTEKFKLDVWYIDNFSLLLDIKILILTVYKVIKKDGISQNEHVSMEKFNGTN